MQYLHNRRMRWYHLHQKALHGLHTVHIHYITDTTALTAFDDSDDEDGAHPPPDPEAELQPEPEFDAPDPPSPPSPAAPPLLQPGPASAAPFDFMNFMAKTGGKDISACLKDMDRQMQDHPVHVPSERPGGHTRREEMQQRAATISRSASEAFAFSTSTTLSQGDTDAFLEAFGNVIQSIYVTLQEVVH